MELKMKAICEGRKTPQEVIRETIEQYRAVYVRTQRHLNVLHAVSLTPPTQTSLCSLIAW